MKKRIVKILLVLAFAAYLLCALYLLLIRRHQFADSADYWTNVKNHINLTPFDTIILFWRVLRNSGNEYLIRVALSNIAGNVAVFIPLGIFLPCIWKRQRKLLWFFLTVTLSIVCVEVTQVFTLLGIGDVDDIILNVTGALIGFAIWKLPPINRFLYKVELLF